MAMYLGTYLSRQPSFTKLYTAIGTYEGFVRSEIMECMKRDGFTEAQLARVWPRVTIQPLDSGRTAKG